MDHFDAERTLVFYYMPDRFNPDTTNDWGLKKVIQRAVLPALYKLESKLKTAIGDDFSFFNYQYVLW